MAKLTRFERARLLSARALQVSLGAPLMVKAPKDALPIDIARLELEKGVVPMTVLRHYPDGRIERVEVA